MKNIVFTISLLMFFSLYPQSQMPKHITLCWDTSASMATRDLDKEFELLDKLFDRRPDVEVQLLLFNVSVKESNYQIKNGDWTQLKGDLQKQAHDGGTYYGLLKDRISHSEAYVFTDGRKLFKDDIMPLPEKGTLVNSCVDRDLKFLERTALLNRGKLIDFTAVLPGNIKQLGTQSQRNEAGAPQLLRGTVYSDNRPVVNAEIRVKGGSGSYRTDANGAFEVPATVGDSLIVSSAQTVGPQTVGISALAHTNVFLEDGTVQLEEVIVQEKKEDQIETVNLGFAEIDKEKAGFAVYDIEEENISEVEITLTDVLNEVPGIEIGAMNPIDRNNSGLSNARIRGRASINFDPKVLVVIDGVPMQRSQTDTYRGRAIARNAPYDFIDPGNIKKITVLKGLAATNLYGSEGRGGVVLITSKTGSFSKKEGNKDNHALLKNNVYNAKGFSVPSAFLEALQESGDADGAYRTYLSLRDINAGNVSFYLDAFSYFKDRDADRAKRIITNLIEMHPGNVAFMKMAALCLSSLEDHGNVLRLNNAILSKEPSSVNAHYAMARAKEGKGKYQNALKNLMALRSGRGFFSVDASGIAKTLDRDIKNLVHRHANTVSKAGIDGKYFNNIALGARLVFEWNDPGQQFEIQFVNPQNRYFNWEYGNMADKQRVADGLNKNYALEEFEMFTSDKGRWVVNAKYLGHVDSKNTVPLLLKCTVYHDFGLPGQKQEHIVLYFDRTGQKKPVKEIVID